MRIDPGPDVEEEPEEQKREMEDEVPERVGARILEVKRRHGFENGI